jgi:hypothetical protein
MIITAKWMQQRIPSWTAIGVALAAGIALGASAGPASAETAHDKWTYLHFPARANDTTAIADRTITLRGSYTFTGFSSYAAPPERPEGMRVPSKPRIGLKLRGRYIWRDWIVVERGRYVHRAMLENARTGGRVFLPRHVLPNRGEGQYHWGSTLHNDRSGTTVPSD